MSLNQWLGATALGLIVIILALVALLLMMLILQARHFTWAGFFFDLIRIAAPRLYRWLRRRFPSLPFPTPLPRPGGGHSAPNGALPEGSMQGDPIDPSLQAPRPPLRVNRARMRTPRQPMSAQTKQLLTIIGISATSGIVLFGLFFLAGLAMDVAAYAGPNQYNYWRTPAHRLNFVYYALWFSLLTTVLIGVVVAVGWMLHQRSVVSVSQQDLAYLQALRANTPLELLAWLQNLQRAHSSGDINHLNREQSRFYVAWMSLFDNDREQMVQFIAYLMTQAQENGYEFRPVPPPAPPAWRNDPSPFDDDESEIDIPPFLRNQRRRPQPPVQ